MIKLDYVKIDSRLSIEKFKDKLDKSIEWLHNNHPEWIGYESWIDVEEDAYDETNSCILLRYHRKATEKEEMELERMKNESIQRDKDTLKRLMEKYPDEVVQNFKKA